MFKKIAGSLIIDVNCSLLFPFTTQFINDKHRSMRWKDALFRNTWVHGAFKDLTIWPLSTF